MLLKLFFLFSIVALIPSVFLFFALNIKSKKSLFRKLFWVTPIFIVFGLLTITFLVDKKFINVYETHLGWVVMAYFMLTLPRLIYSIVLIITAPARFIRSKLGKPIFILSLIIALSAEVVMIYGMAMGRNKFEVSHFTYESSQVPEEFDGYTIAQLSDIHIGGWFGNRDGLQMLINMTNQLHPDMIVFTGDLVNHRTIELEGYEDILSQLTAKDGVFSILGNHDYGSYYRYWKDEQEYKDNLTNLFDRQRNMGWELLNNEHRIIRKGNDSIALIGVENDGEPPFSQYADLPKAIDGLNGEFKVLLSHNPTHWKREVLTTTDIDLMLAGHTHAMQLELFGFSPAVWKYKEWGGPYFQDNRCLYVNIGAGEVGIPFRFGAWPEITLITLKHKK